MRLLALLCLLGCSAPAPVARVPDAPRPGRSDVLSRIPGDVWLVTSIDLDELRRGTAWRWLRDFVLDRSTAMRACAAQLEHATRVTIALRESDEVREKNTTFAIVDGIDRAAIAACLHHPPAEVTQPPVGRAECDRYDAAVHELHECGVVPTSSLESLQGAAAALATGEPREACTRAAVAVERANARRKELGWDCKSSHSDRSFGWYPVKALDIDRDTIALGDHEVAHFVGEHRVELVTTTAFHESAAAWTKAALAELSPHDKQWFLAPAAALDRHTMAWFVAKPELAEIKHAPALVSGRVWLGVAVGVDVRIEGASFSEWGEWIRILERGAADPDFAGASVHVGCAVPPLPAGPEQRACESAVAHAAALESAGAVDYSGLGAERVERCVEDRWPATVRSCLESAPDTQAVDACFQQLPVKTTSGLCGDHPLELRAEVPQMRIEALKLVTAIDRTAKRDCREPSKGPATSTALGTALADRTRPFASACFDDRCEFAALGPVEGNEDGRWRDEEWIQRRCLGPFSAGPDLQWHSPGGGCGFTFSQYPGIEQAPVAVTAEAKQWRVCQGTSCTLIPRRGALVAMSIDGNIAAVMLADGAIETWNLAKRARIATFRAPERGCSLAVVGESLALGCAHDAYLATMAGKRIGAIGDAHFDAIASEPIALGGQRWAFVARTGESIAIQDVATGKVEKMIATALSADAGMVSAAGDGAGSIAIAYGGAGTSAGTIAVVNPDGTVHAYQRTACPP